METKGTIVSRAHVDSFVVRPRRHLLCEGVLAIGLVLVALMVPLLWFAVPNGTVPVIAMAAIAIVALTGVGAADFARISIRVADDVIEKRSFLTRPFTVPVAGIAAVHLVPVYPTGSVRTNLQLLAVDASGRRLLRMRGQHWARTDMLAVASQLNAPLLMAEEPLTMPEFHEQHPSAAYWYENRPALTAIGFAVVLVVAAAITLGMLMLAGVPLNGA